MVRNSASRSIKSFNCETLAKELELPVNRNDDERNAGIDLVNVREITLTIFPRESLGNSLLQYIFIVQDVSLKHYLLKNVCKIDGTRTSSKRPLKQFNCKSTYNFIRIFLLEQVLNSIYYTCNLMEYFACCSVIPQRALLASRRAMFTTLDEEVKICNKCQMHGTIQYPIII